MAFSDHKRHSPCIADLICRQIHACGLRALLAAGTCHLLGLTDHNHYDLYQQSPKAVRLYLYVFGPANNQAYTQAIANLAQGAAVQGPIAFANAPAQVSELSTNNWNVTQKLGMPAHCVIGQTARAG